MDKWRVYKKMIISTLSPHENLSLEDIRNGVEKLKETNSFLCRYTSNFDCNITTEWWYCIKDSIDDLEKLSSSKRYEIKKGIKRAYVKNISYENNYDDMYYVYKKSFERYKFVERLKSKEKFVQDFENEKILYNVEVYGVYLISSDRLVGYSINYLYFDYVSYSSIKLIPSCLKDGISAALIYSMNNKYLCNKKYKYILDGERSIRHESNIQDYLEKYFGFRKAYCKLNIIYKPNFKLIINLLFPFKNILSLVKIKIFKDISAILEQERINRWFEKNYRT